MMWLYQNYIVVISECCDYTKIIVVIPDEHGYTRDYTTRVWLYLYLVVVISDDCGYIIKQCCYTHMMWWLYRNDVDIPKLDRGYIRTMWLYLKSSCLYQFDMVLPVVISYECGYT